jgi:hypothetical protein
MAMPGRQKCMLKRDRERELYRNVYKEREREDEDEGEKIT